MRRLRWIVVLAGVAAGISRPCFAARTEFEPRLFALWSYSDNVGVIETSAAADGSTDASDQYVNLGVELPVSRILRFGTLGFTYSGMYTRYNRYSIYDNMAHGANFRVRPALRRGGTLSFEVFYTLSQEQGTPARIDEDEQFLTARTDRTFFGTRVWFNQDGRRSYWDAELRGTRAEFSAIEGTPVDPLPPDPGALALVPESRTSWFGSFEYRRKFSRRFSLGPHYEAGYVQLERNADEVFQVLSVAFSWVVSESFSFDARTGAYRRSTRADAAVGGEAADETGFAWALTLRIDPPLTAIQQGKIKLGLDVGISPSGGGALQGTSTDSYLRLYLASGTTRSPWSWEAGTRYTRRESTLDGFPTFQTAGLEGFVDYGVGSLVSLRLSGGWSEQLDAESEETNASFGVATLGVVVYPRGKARARG